MHALIGLMALAFVPYETEGGIPLHWPPGATPEVRVERTPPDGLDAAAVLGLAGLAFDAWLDAPCPAVGGAAMVDLRPDVDAPALGDATLDEADGVIALVWMDDAAAWNARFGQLELARTILIHRRSTGEIVDADVAVNFGGYAFTTSATCLPDHYDLRSTLTHEVGHVLGLDHSPVASATMAPRTDPGACDLRDLDPDDVAGICATYVRPATPEPAPEAGPEPTPEPAPEAAEAEAGVHGGEDGCAGGGGLGGLAGLALSVVAGLVAAGRVAVRSGRRASA